MKVSDFQNPGDIVSFAFKATTKQDIIAKLQEEVKWCKETKQRTLRFFYHYGMDQMQFIDTNSQYQAVRGLYRMQGYSFAGSTPTKGITAEMVGPAVRNLKMNLFKGSKSNPVDPLSVLMGYMPAETEIVVFEMDIDIFK